MHKICSIIRHEIKLIVEQILCIKLVKYSDKYTIRSKKKTSTKFQAEFLIKLMTNPTFGLTTYLRAQQLYSTNTFTFKKSRLTLFSFGGGGGGRRGPRNR